MRVLNGAQVARCLAMHDAIGAMRQAFLAHVRGEVSTPPRTVLPAARGRGATLVMPAAEQASDRPLLTVKTVAVVPENRRRGLPSIHGTLLVLDARTGVPLALMDATTLTAIRTAAACGLATDLLARKDSSVLAVFGSGVHARTQVRAVSAVRPITTVRIFNPNAASARSMAAELERAPYRFSTVRAVRSAAAALDGAHVACTATTSRVPVFDDADVPEGIHINAIGAFKPADRELPGSTVVRAHVAVDDRHAALEEAGDLLIPMADGFVGADHIRADLGGLLLGRDPGRRSDRQLTVFKSVGLAVQDLFAARSVLHRAEELGVGDGLEL